jgi:hypothetical protein
MILAQCAIIKLLLLIDIGLTWASSNPTVDTAPSGEAQDIKNNFFNSLCVRVKVIQAKAVFKYFHDKKFSFS